MGSSDDRPSYFYAASSAQVDLEAERVKYFESAIGTTSDKLNSLSRFMSRQNLAKTLCYADLFRMTAGVCGSILDCGVFYGNGLMTYALLAAALEPYNYQCKVIGFDTFAGDTGASDIDKLGYKGKGVDFKVDSHEDLQRAIAIYDGDRALNHMPRIELVKGDLCQTAPGYVEANPHLMVRILHLSVNLYEPTRAALEAFLPRMPRGAAVVVHALNYTPGATKAVLDAAGPDRPVRAFDYYPNITYFIV